MAGCASTKTLVKKPLQETESTGAESETVSYPSQQAGTVTELYGEDAESEQSQAYRDAIAENPLLRYIVVYFDFNQVEITEASREVLVQHANYFSKHPDVEVSVEGHADKRGSSGYNLALGERRALAVKNFLSANEVREFQISIVSYGEERPALSGNDEEAFAKNRRVELVYR